MAIDYSDWMKSSVTSAPLRVEPEYRMVSQDDAWTQLRTWLRLEIVGKEGELLARVSVMQLSGDYHHEAMITNKVLVDITQAQLLTLSRIEQKILSYTKEAVDA